MIASLNKARAHPLAVEVGNFAFSVRTRPGRDGFSLLELFLVMAILAVISIIGWPMLYRPLNQSIAQGAAQNLRKELAIARLQAMESGRPVFFQFRPGTSQYWIGESPVANQLSESNDSTRLTPGEFENPDQSRNSPTGPLDGQGVPTKTGSRQLELPGGVVFSPSRVDLPPDRIEGNMESGLQSEPIPESGSSNDSLAWSSPIRFYSSGRIVPARVSMQSAEGYFVEVEIQGLAGRVKVLPIHR